MFKFSRSTKLKKLIWMMSKQFLMTLRKNTWLRSLNLEKVGPLVMNAFEMNTLSQGLNLSALFDRRQDYIKRQTRFVSRKPAKTIISSIKAVAESMGLKVHTRNFKTRIEKLSTIKVAKFAIVLEVYEIVPSLFMIDVPKTIGETREYHKFYKNFCSKLYNIIWKTTDGANPGLLRTMTC